MELAPGVLSQKVGIFHKSTARLCGQFITHLFACPEYPPTSSGLNTKLPHFIIYALHCTIVLICHLRSVGPTEMSKSTIPAAQGFSGHRLFISVFIQMVCTQISCGV